MATLSSRLAPLTVSVPAMSEWTSYTPTWSSSGTQPVLGNGVIFGFWRRVGDSVEIRINVVFGSTSTFGTGNWKFSLPSGLAIDTAKIQNATNSGSGLGYDASATTSKSLVARYAGATDGLLLFATEGTGLIVTATTPFTWATSDEVNVTTFLPISGWTSHTASATSANAVVVGGQSVGSKLNIGATSNQGVALLANNAAIVDSNSTGLTALKFSPVASVSADANTLDDYEEGTWTPTLTFGGGSSGMSYDQRIGTYTKIGRVVFFTMFIELGAKGSSTGVARVTGLPFTPIAAATVGYGTCNWFANGVSVNGGQIGIYIEPSTSSLEIGYASVTSNGGSSISVNDTHFAAASGNIPNFQISGFYLTAS